MLSICFNSDSVACKITKLEVDENGSWRDGGDIPDFLWLQAPKRWP